MIQALGLRAYINIAGGLALIALLWFAHHQIYQSGWHDRDVIAIANEASIQKQAQERLKQATKAAHDRELKLSTQLSDISTKSLQKETEYEQKITRLNGLVRDGAVRLSIATRSQVSGCTAPTNHTIASQPSAETRAELMPEASEFLIGLAAKCDRNVRQLNAVIDAYNEAREVANAK